MPNEYLFVRNLRDRFHSWRIFKDFPLDVRQHDFFEDGLDGIEGIILVAPDDPMQNSFIKVIGKIIFGYQHKPTVFFDSLSDFELLGLMHVLS